MVWSVVIVIMEGHPKAGPDYRGLIQVYLESWTLALTPGPPPPSWSQRTTGDLNIKVTVTYKKKHARASSEHLYY